MYDLPQNPLSVLQLFLKQFPSFQNMYINQSERKKSKIIRNFFDKWITLIRNTLSGYS